MMNIKEVLLQQLINCLINKTSGTGIKNDNMSKQQLEEELYKPIIKEKNSTITFYRQYSGC